jgi:hypothetical protein
MTQATCGFGFAAKSFADLFIGHKLRRYDFQSDRSFGAKMGGEKDRAHTTLTKEFVEEVFAIQGLPYEFFEFRH